MARLRLAGGHTTSAVCRCFGAIPVSLLARLQQMLIDFSMRSTLISTANCMNVAFCHLLSLYFIPPLVLRDRWPQRSVAAAPAAALRLLALVALLCACVADDPDLCFMDSNNDGTCGGNCLPLYRIDRVFACTICAVCVCVCVCVPHVVISVRAGIDGELVGPYFVAITGNDSNSGRSYSAPYRTLQKAYAVASAASNGSVALSIYITAGTFSETGSLVMKPGVSVYGGYSNSLPGVWRRLWAPTILSFSHDTAVIATNIVNLVGGKHTILELLDIRAAHAPHAGAPVGATPRSSYALFANNADGLLLRAVTLVAGWGEVGWDQVTVPARSAPGGHGAWGSAGCMSGNGSGCGDCAAPPRGAGGSGCPSSGGTGGYAGHGDGYGTNGDAGGCASSVDGITYSCQAGTPGSGGAGGEADGCETAAGCPATSCCRTLLQGDKCCWKNEMDASEERDQCASPSAAGKAGRDGQVPTLVHVGTPGTGTQQPPE